MLESTYEQHRRAITLRPEDWRRFKMRCLAADVSPATRLGQLVEDDLADHRAGSAELSVGERRAIWTALNDRVYRLPLNATANRPIQQVLVEFRALVELRDRFADAFDPPKPTMPEPELQARTSA